MGHDWFRVGNSYSSFATTCFERTTGELWFRDDLIIIGEGDTPTSPASDLRSSDADVSD